MQGSISTGILEATRFSKHTVPMLQVFKSV